MELYLAIVRWAVAMTVGLTLAAATTHAAPQPARDIAMLTPMTTASNLVASPGPVITPSGPPQTVGPTPTAPSTLEALVAFHAADVDNIDPDTECMAKVVQHEAGNQPLQGQLAVAEVIVNRTHSGRFATTPCAVANQRGQFFQTDGYHVQRTSRQWRTAVALARVARAGEAPPVVPGALFFHASYAGGGHGRAVVKRIGGQIFYR
jgi:hypothetical protein